MIVSSYRIVWFFVLLTTPFLAFSQGTESSDNTGPCKGSPELNVSSNNINMDQRTMTFFLEGDIFVTGKGFCFTTDSKVTLRTKEDSPSEIDEFEISGPFELTLAKEEQTKITANKGNYLDVVSKFVFEGDVVFTDFYENVNETLSADRGEYLLDSDNFKVDHNVVLKIDNIEIESDHAEYISTENMARFTSQVKMVNNDPAQPSEINSDVAEYLFDQKTLILISNVSGNYGPSNFAGRDRLVYNWSSE